MGDFQAPSLKLTWFRFCGGVAWAALISAMVSAATRTSFWPVFLVALPGMLATAALGLAWLTLWAQRRNSLPGQFTIGSMLFATCFVAIFFAAVRWIGAHVSHFHGMHPAEGQVYLPVTIMVALAAAISIPIALGMLDSMLRAAIWSLRKPSARVWLKRIRTLWH